ncbi:MAG TPA: DUF72 domain-containing protein [Chloroflexia bacterium]|nr:DUF72 domain-containing protein [Chloroflexia bacterium]
MIWIGTSGWVYKHWIGCFYPPEMKQKDWLRRFASEFPTVEINRSFYRLPTHENFVAWAEQAAFRGNFLFAVKASRYLTHLKKLHSPEEPLARMVGAAEGLGPHLGPFLYQLPPRWPADTARLSYFISRLPQGYRAAFEFRDNSWYSPEVLRILDESGCALVRAVGGYYTPVEVPDAGSFRYIRFHGGQYGTGMTDGELHYWAERIASDASNGLDVYVYFNNDPECHAIYDARRLKEMLLPTGAVVL